MNTMASRRFTPRSIALGFLVILVILLYVRSGSDVSRNATSGTKLRIGILTLTTRESSYMHMSLSNKDEYARKHGYDLVVDYKNLAPKGPVWHKMIMVENAINTNKYDWIWWLDFDTLVTNMTIKVEDIITRYAKLDTDMILTADCFPLNAGSMLLRSTPRLMTYINKIRSCGDSKERISEQDCLRDQIKDDNLIEKGRVVMAPQWEFNAFPEEIGCFDKHKRKWQRGMFIIHFAGAWAHVKGEDPTGQMMRKYEINTIHG